MQQSGEAVKVVPVDQFPAHRKSAIRRSEAVAVLVAVLIVAIWLLASWTATAAEIVL